jgi:hypothetical protein
LEEVARLAADWFKRYLGGSRAQAARRELHSAHKTASFS